MESRPKGGRASSMPSEHRPLGSAAGSAAGSQLGSQDDLSLGRSRAQARPRACVLRADPRPPPPQQQGLEEQAGRGVPVHRGQGAHGCHLSGPLAVAREKKSEAFVVTSASACTAKPLRAQAGAHADRRHPPPRVPLPERGEEDALRVPFHSGPRLRLRVAEAAAADMSLTHTYAHACARVGRLWHAGVVLSVCGALAGAGREAVPAGHAGPGLVSDGVPRQPHLQPDLQGSLRLSQLPGSVQGARGRCSAPSPPVLTSCADAARARR
jgi:hypothetical protein